MTEKTLTSENIGHESKLLDMAFGKMALSSASALLLSILIVAALWPVIEHERLLSWLGVMAGIQTINFFLARRYLRTTNGIASGTRKWRAKLIAAGIAAGLCWGSTVFSFPSTPFVPETVLGVFVLPASPFDPVTVLLMFILAGVAAYASVAMAFVPMLAMTFLASALLPLSIWLLTFGEHMYIVMGLISLSYLGVMLVLTKRMHATVCNLISVSEENRGLRLAQQEAGLRMQRFFESAPGFFYTAHMSPDGVSSMPFASAGIADLTGIPAGKVTHSLAPLLDLIHPEDARQLMNARQVAFKNLSELQIEFRINHPVKGERWIELRSLPQRDRDGGTTLYGYMNDVTGRKRVEMELAGHRDHLEELVRQRTAEVQQREALLRALVDNLPFEFFAMDASLTYTMQNAVSIRNYGPVAGKRLEELGLPDEVLAAWVQQNREVLAGKTQYAEYEKEVAGEKRVYESLVAPVRTGEAIIGLVGVGMDVTERKLAEAQIRTLNAELEQRVADRTLQLEAANRDLRESEQRFRALSENAPDPIYRYDRNCRRIYINPAVERLTGKPLAVLLGKSPIEAMPVPDVSAAEAQRAIQRVLDTGEPGELEVDFIAANGQRAVIHNVLVPECDEGGAVQTVLCIGRDITAHKRIEEVLLRSEVEYRTLAANLPVAVIRYDAEQRRTYINPAAERMLHGDATQMLGQVPGEGGVPASAQMIALYRGKMTEVLESGESRDFEFAMDALPQEQQEQYAVRMAPEYGNDGRIAGVLATWFDLTGRKQAENALQQSEIKFRTLYDSTGDAVMLLDEQGFFDCNAAALKMFGCATREEFCTKHPADLSPSVQLDGTDSMTLANRHIAQAMQEGSHRFEWIHRRADSNESFPAEVLLSSMQLDGKPVLQATVRDISERKLMQDELAERERDFSSLAGNMPDNIARFDTEGRYLYVNPTHERLLGRKLDELIGQPIPESHAQVKAGIAQVAATGQAIHAVRQPVMVNGVEELHDVSLVPEFDDTGKVVSVLGMGRDMTERYRMLETIAAREQEFRSLAESSPDFIIRYDRDGRTRYLNSSLLSLLGLGSADEVIGKCPSETWTDGRFDAIERAAARAVETGEKQIIDMTGPRENGELGYNQIFVVPERDAHGEIIGTIAFGRDVTAIREAELRLAHFVDNLPGLAYTFHLSQDGQASFPYVSQAVEEIYGLKPEEAMGDFTPIHMLSHPDDRPVIEAAIAESARAMTPFRVESRVCRPGHAERWLDVRSVPEPQPDGGILWYGLMLDITERKQAQQRMELLEHAIGVSSDAVYLIDDELRFSYVNDAACRTLGYAQEELLAMGPHDIDPGISREIAQNVLETSPLGVPVSFETQHRTKDGRIIPVELHGTHFERGGRKFGLSVVRDISERKRMEAQIAQERATLRTFFDAMPNLAWMKDAEGRYLACNPLFEQLYGQTEEDILGKTDFDFVDAELAAFFRQKDKEATAAGKPCINEEWVTFAVDGRRALIETVKAPVFRADGQIVGVIGVAQDITERKRMQAELQEQAAFQQTLLDALHDANFQLMMVEEGRITYVGNRDIAYQIGYTDAEIDAHPPLLDIIHPDDRARVGEYYRRRLAGEEAPTRYELGLVTREGKRIEYETSIAVVPGSNPLRMVTIGWNISERKRTETELAESQMRYRQIFDNAQEGIFLLDVSEDRRFRVIEANPTFAQLIGIARGDMIGRFVDEILLPETAQKVSAKYNRCIDSGEVYAEEQELQLPVGLHIYHTKLVPVRNENGRVARLVGITEDITERRRAQEALQRSEQLMRTVIDATPDWIFIKDRDHRYRLVNQGYAEALHLVPEDFIGKTDLDLGFPDELVKGNPEKGIRGFWTDDRLVLDSNETQVFPDDPATIDGEVHTFHTIKVPLRDANEMPWGVLAFARDISERKQYERSLSESRNFLNRIIDGITDPIFVKDREHRWVLCNDAFANLIGQPREALIGKSDYDFLPKEQSDVFWEKDELVFASGETNLNEEAITGADGEARYIHTKKMPFVASDGQILLVGVIRDITERKRIEEALRANEEKLSTLFALSPLGIALTDMQGRYVEFNEAFRAICGYPADELMTLDYWTLTPKEYEAKEAEQIESLARTGRYGPYEKEYRQKDGTLVPIQLSGVRVTGKDGKQYIWSIVEDITERKKSEALLREKFERIVELNMHLEENARTLEEQTVELEASQEQLKESLEFTSGVIAAIPDILFEMDRNGRYLNVWTQNPDVLAEQRNLLVGKTVSEVLPQNTAAMAMAAIREADEQGFAYGHTIPITQIDGEVRWYEHSLAKKRGGSMANPTFIVLSRDITERKQAEKALRESFDKISELNLHLEENARSLEEQTVELEASQEQIKQTEAWYRSILHSAPDGLLVVDESGVIVQVNARLESMFGYGRGELAGLQVEALLPQALRGQHVHQRSEYFASGVDLRPAMAGKTLFGCRKDGSIFPVDVGLSRLPGINGVRNAICASVRDITERHALESAREAALAEAQRLAQLRSAFMAQMSHELRTPLNGILGYTQNLLHDRSLAEKQQTGLKIIQHSGEHLLSLINGLLDHAAIEADKFELIYDEIEIDGFLSGIIGIIRVRADQKNIAFVCEAGADLPAVVRGDAQRLRQVLLNLLSNAVKFTDRGSVTLRVNLAAPTRIRFIVQDSGVGIPADQLEAIFQPFEQVGETHRRAGGTGLGLAISRKLVRLMGGDIKVESQLGGGSTFSFEIETGSDSSGAARVDAAALSAKAGAQVVQAAQLLAPPLAELDTLHGLALRGSMRDVTRHADRLAAADERYQPFAAQLRQLAQSFQTKALLGLIEQYRAREQKK